MVLQYEDFNARGISVLELPNQKSKGLHLRIEVKQSLVLDNSSWIIQVHLEYFCHRIQLCLSLIFTDFF